MQDEDKTKEQLIDELAEARKRITELEALKAAYKRSDTNQGQIGECIDSPDWISVQEDITEQKQAE